MDLISLLVYLIIFAVIVYLIYFVIGKMSLPEPIGNIVLIVVGVILLLILFGMLTGNINAPRIGFGR